MIAKSKYASIANSDKFKEIMQSTFCTIFRIFYKVITIFLLLSAINRFYDLTTTTVGGCICHPKSQTGRDLTSSNQFIARLPVEPHQNTHRGNPNQTANIRILGGLDAAVRDDIQHTKYQKRRCSGIHRICNVTRQQSIEQRS